VYTLDMNVLSDLVEEARLRYLEVNRPNVVIYLTDSVRIFSPPA
jgi:chaperone BCS1